MQRLFKDRFFWYIGLLVVCTGALTAFGMGVPSEGIAAWSQVYIPVQRLAFSVAVLAASWRFGARGGWLVCLVGGIFILARHTPSLSQGFTDIQARDTLVETGLVVLGVLVSWFVGSYQREPACLSNPSATSSRRKRNGAPLSMLSPNRFISSTMITIFCV